MFLKKFSLLFVLMAALTQGIMAQKNKDYTEQWKKVAAFEKKGLTASALKEVLVIYNLAVKDNNDVQQVKSCIYQVKYRDMTQEDSQEKNILFVDTLIAKAKLPAKNILQSMQAEMFWRYLQLNRWKFYSRTRLEEEKSKDISTWSLEKLHSTIAALYRASINEKNELLLKQTKISEFDPIIIKGENTRHLRPTLFDFLSFRALDYFISDERDIIKPAYYFKIDDEAAFAPAKEFIKHSFENKDSASLHHQALGMFQRILDFHLNDEKKDALLDADLARLNFVYQYAVNSDKKRLYEAALKNIEEKFPSNEAAAQAMYLRAKIYFDNGQQFVSLSKTDNQYEIKRAKELCDAAVAKFPNSEGGINAQNLINIILQPSLSLETEKVNIPGQPFRTLVKYKNVKTVYFRLIKISRAALKAINAKDYQKSWQEYVSLKPVKSWSVALPDPQDFQDHAVEAKVDGVENGIYLVMACMDQDFSLQKNIIARQVIYISNISYIHNNKSDYYVLNRDNGLPLGNSTVQVWESKYDYNKGKYTEEKAEQYTTDQNGLFKLKKQKENRHVYLQVTNGNDELFLEEGSYDGIYNSGVSEELKPVSFLFTDRSIYRPGQTVYFKGIVFKNTSKTSKAAVLQDFKTNVRLMDANGQKINELSLTTNAYGSYHGSFRLPEGSLNGQFRLQDDSTSGTQYFSVEEYKRPKFLTEIKKPAGTYRVNDSITVTGTAKGYAGNNIDGAEVKYRVVRKVVYPLWFGWGATVRKGGRMIWPPYGRNEEVEITNAVTVTGNQGEFNINFKAIPDESVDKKSQPIFYYEVSADVTDVNGETRSGETSVAVAYQALKLEIMIRDKMPADSLKNILVKSTNLNDIEDRANVAVSITRLKTPGKVFRERYWEQPDQFVMSKDEYYQLFPHDVYSNENEVANYAPGDKVFDKTDSSNKAWQIEKGKLQAGWYKIVAVAKDKYGEDVRAEKLVLFTGSQAAETEPVTVTANKTTAAPGEKIAYDIATGFDNIWMINTLSKMNDGVEVNHFHVQPGKKYTKEIAVNEADRGGIEMSYAFVKYNRVYTGGEQFMVPWNNKELTISYGTFRDKLLPGATEKWTVKISGNKGEKLSAELLAAMYDASLDQFQPHQWSRIDIWPRLYGSVHWQKNGFESASSQQYSGIETNAYRGIEKSYDYLNWAHTVYNRDRQLYRKAGRVSASRSETLEMANASPVYDSLGTVGDFAAAEKTVHMKLPKPVAEDTDGDGVANQADKEPNTAAGLKVNKDGVATASEPDIKIRKNFNETAFFFPELTTDADGNVSFGFTMPEALTQWKLMTLAHTKELASGYIEKTVVTQKPLMVQPNAPRFMREGDKMEFSAKVVNLSDGQLTGTTTLGLLDAATNQPVDAIFRNITSSRNFTVAAGQSTAVLYSLEIPANFNSALAYRIVAKAGTTPSGDGGFSDGEEMSLPVLTNRTLVTESLPLNLRGNEKNKNFKFEKLLKASPIGGGLEGAVTLSNHALTVEYTSNPAWYAVQALPYLMEYPYECAEQTFNRYYANTLASYISNTVPRIKSVFEKWKTVDTAALLSNLQKNEELKSALLQETPWVMEAQNESQQKKNIALLFDIVRMSSETAKSIATLKEMQSANGGFVWFKGGPDDRYITQYIITGIGHLKKLNAISASESQQVKEIMAIAKKAMPYLDKKIKEDYDYLVKHKVKLSNNNLGSIAVQYLYMRSMFPETAVPAASQKAYNYYLSQGKKYWLSNSKYMQAMIALILQRNKDGKTATAIIRSLKENAISNDELGMYWKEWNNRGWFWYQAPIESQAMMIEAFTEIDRNQHTIDDLKTWLLKQKQTQNWGTTKATSEACYALLLNGSDWLKEEKEVVINLGSTTIKSTDNSAEAGTGYFKKRINGTEVKPEMGNISVAVQPSNNSTVQQSTSWGAVYWQYFEDLDKITSAETPLKLAKKLFVERNTDKGPVLDAVEDGARLKVGDKIKVRIELRVDRDMEYVHMKDLRAACMEPVNVLSGYKYQGGLGYYESTKDASTNFFFNWLNRGTYVFEYSLFVTHQGNFSNGITTIQCMYAPEFTSHSEGLRVTVQ